MLYHQGQRNYECPKCNNKFYQMEHLKRHLTSIHKLNIPQIGRGNRLFGSDLLKRVKIYICNRISIRYLERVIKDLNKDVCFPLAGICRVQN
jgi:hypothetical protein